MITTAGSQVTQEQIDQAVAHIRRKWSEMLAESGQNQAVFVATSHEATQLLASYEIMRQQGVDNGFILPPLIDGVTVSFVDDDANDFGESL